MFLFLANVYIYICVCVSVCFYIYIYIQSHGSKIVVLAKKVCSKPDVSQVAESQGWSGILSDVRCPGNIEAVENLLQRDRNSM